MALEDAPRHLSAPSPPGIPHSPHSTSSPMVLDMSLNGQNTIYMNPCIKSGYERKLQFNENLLENSTINLEQNIKEENESIVSEHENEQENENLSDEEKIQQNPIPVLSFSITNILSDHFGNKKFIPDKKIGLMATKKTTSSTRIFRPYEIIKKTTQNSDRSAFKNLHNDIYDYSQNVNAITAAALVERANFLNCFNPINYPRIHEEIINNTRHNKHINNNIKNDIKIPPLGGLCKTISQIGQESSPSLNLTTISNRSSISPRLSTISPQPGQLQLSTNRDSGMESSDDARSETSSTKDGTNGQIWPAWVFCTRYSDRPSSGPRYRRPKQPKEKHQAEEKRPRTAFSSEQLARLKREFNESKYLTERRRLQLSSELGLNEAQIKIWFQNKRAKIKKASGSKNPLALQLMAQGLYNHTTVPLTKEEEELEMRMNGQIP